MQRRGRDFPYVKLLTQFAPGPALAVFAFRATPLNKNIAAGFKFTEREGFEPSKPCGLQVFETCCFNHSHTSPILLLPSGRRK